MKPPVRLRNVKNKKKSNSTATPLLKKKFDKKKQDGDNKEQDNIEDKNEIEDKTTIENKTTRISGNN